MDTAYSSSGSITSGRGMLAAAPVALRRISWGAILAGSAVAMVIQLVLNLLGLGIGASTINPTSEQNALGGLGWGTLIWLVVSTLLALFAGGWVAGRLAGFPKRLESSLHGLITFAVVTLLTFYLLTTAIGAILSTTTNVLGQSLSTVVQGAAAVAPVVANSNSAPQVYAYPNPNARSSQQPSPGMVEQWLAQAGIQTTTPQASQQITQSAMNYLQALIVSDQQTVQQRRQALVDTVAMHTTLTEQEINSRVDQLHGQTQEGWQKVKQQVAQTSESAAQGVAAASFGAFIALVLGGIAAVLGALIATPAEGVFARAHVEPAGHRDRPSG